MEKVILYGGQNCTDILRVFEGASRYVECIVSTFSKQKEVAGIPVRGGGMPS